MIQVSLIAVLSADGYIARRPDETVDWSSAEDKQLFVTLTKATGTIIIGSTTYKTLPSKLLGRRVIVYSHTSLEGVETTQEEPEALLRRLENEGVRAVAICGGASVYDAFLRTDLIHELHLVTEPLLFGTGIRLCYEPLHTRLHLTEHRQLNTSGTVYSHYEVRT